MQLRTLCGKGALLAHCQLINHQDLQVLFCKPAFQLVRPQHTLVCEVVPPQVQDSVHPFEIAFRDFPVSRFFQPVEVSLDNNMILQYISQYFHCCVTT